MTVHGVFRNSLMTLCYEPTTQFRPDEIADIENDISAINCEECLEVNREQVKARLNEKRKGLK